jgi:hypothetical protein
VDCGIDGRAAARGEFCTSSRDRKQRSRGGSEVEEGGKVRGLVWNI